jgi:hypothetical protein
MAVYNNYVVEYLNGATWTAISNVQNLSCTVGRQRASDQWQVSTTTITIWYPNGFSNPIANLGVDTKIRFFCPGRSTTEPTWTGSVADMSIDLGIPWNSATNTGNSDFLVLSCEGETAKQGRLGYTKPDGTVGAPAVSYFVRVVLGSNYNIVTRTDPFTDFGRFDTINVPLETDILTAWDAMLGAGIYCSARIIDGVRKKASDWSTTAGTTNDPGVDFKSGKLLPADISTVEFSDTANSSTKRIYDQFEFDNAADQYFTSSQINTSANGVVYEPLFNGIAIGSSEPRRQFTATAYGEVTANNELMQEVADYYANVYDSAEISPFSISAITAGQDTQNLDTLGFSNLELAYLTTKAIRIAFRGQTYLCRIEGVTLTADLDQSRFTYYLSPTDDSGWFILDDADLGVLDQNRLGLY